MSQTQISTHMRNVSEDEHDPLVTEQYIRQADKQTDIWPISVSVWPMNG